MIFLSSPLKYDPSGNMVNIIFFHGIRIVTTCREISDVTIYLRHNAGTEKSHLHLD